MGATSINLFYIVLLLELLKKRRVDELDSLCVYNNRLVHPVYLVEQLSAEYNISDSHGAEASVSWVPISELSSYTIEGFRRSEENLDTRFFNYVDSMTGCRDIVLCHTYEPRMEFPALGDYSVQRTFLSEVLIFDLVDYDAQRS